MKKVVLLFFCCFPLLILHAQCPAGQKQVRIELLTDSYPGETSWKLLDAQNNVLLQNGTLGQNTLYKDSICVPDNSCTHFQILDSYGDGICCNYGHGYFKVFLNNLLTASDSSFGSQSNAWVDCPPGANCSTAIITDTGTFTAPNPDYWYVYTAPNTGQYTFTTCNLNTCITKLYIYDHCANLIPDTNNLATIYYGFQDCGTQANISAYFTAGQTYYLRIGDYGNSCNYGPINWKLTYNGPVSGCMDITACNYNPFASIDDSSCVYYPNPLCPTGPDLVVDSTELATSIYMDTSTTTDVCAIREGCLNGYGVRQRINFSTRIDNFGAQDFTAGTPPANPNVYSPIFAWDLCHGHWHFKDYAQYLLADYNNNLVPIGYKNGFCVLDLTCPVGTGKFSCGNMGITAGCADIYSSGLPCQWIDITDVADGDYKLIVRASWQPRPDFYGRYETNYFNNWARTCIHIYHDTNNLRQVDVYPNCAPYYDCMGVENGLAVKDCEGNCNGARLTGDINVDSLRDNVDVNSYMHGAVYHNLPATPCLDLNADTMISVTDAALLFDCWKHGPNAIPVGHTHKSCSFPNVIKNPTQSADFSIGNLDYSNQTVDIFVKNTNSKLLAYQIRLKGLHVVNVQNQVPGFSPTVAFRPSGEIALLTNDEVAIPKNLGPTLLLRVSFDAIDTNFICIDSVVAVVNEAYEEIAHNIVDSQCLAAVPMLVPDVTAGHGISHAVYPNPFTRSANVIMQNIAGAYYTATLYDILGRELRTYPRQNADVLGIDKGALKPGVYFIEVVSDKWRFKEKLLVQ